MSAVPVAQRMTADEFLALDRDRRRAAQLVEGEVIVNEPAILHGYVVASLLVAVANWTRETSSRGTALVPLDVGIDERNVFKPDVLWYAHGHVPDLMSKPSYAVPDLAIEVRSPSTWRYDVGAKRAGYERAGLPELWLVDTEARTVLVYRRSSSDANEFDVALELAEPEELRSPLLPGFALPVAEVFRLP